MTARTLVYKIRLPDRMMTDPIKFFKLRWRVLYIYMQNASAEVQSDKPISMMIMYDDHHDYYSDNMPESRRRSPEQVYIRKLCHPSDKIRNQTENQKALTGTSSVRNQ